MPKLTYAENPVHPVVNDFPAALVPASLVFDMLHLVTRRGAFKVAAFFSMLLALVTGGAAAATGYLDYREIPEGSEAKRLANVHGLLNGGVLVALAFQLLIRMTGKVGLFPRLLNIATNGALAASGWYGTHLVYRHGLRVRGVDPIGTAPDAMPDTGKPIADQLESFASHVPASDLGARIETAVRTQDLDAASPAAGGMDDVPVASDDATDEMRFATTAADDPAS